MTDVYAPITGLPVDLDDGTQLAPGERKQVKASDSVKQAIEDGRLIDTGGAKAAKANDKKEATK